MRLVSLVGFGLIGLACDRGLMEPEFAPPPPPDVRVVIAVSAYATNVFLDDRGFVLLANNLDGGGEFAASGVPLSMGGITIRLLRRSP